MHSLTQILKYKWIENTQIYFWNIFLKLEILFAIGQQNKYKKKLWHVLDFEQFKRMLKIKDFGVSSASRYLKYIRFMFCERKKATTMKNTKTRKMLETE